MKEDEEDGVKAGGEIHLLIRGWAVILPEGPHSSGGTGK